MSFGDGDLHAQVDRLKGVNGELCAEINRQERVIEERDELIGELRLLVDDLWPRASFTMAEGNRESYMERMRELGIEAES